MYQKERENEANYRAGLADGQTRSGSNATLGAILGVLIIGLLGLGAWLYFGQQGNQNQPSETNIIVPDATAPQVPQAPEAPDVNITVPSPDLSLPSPEVQVPEVPAPGDTEGSQSN